MYFVCILVFCHHMCVCGIKWQTIPIFTQPLSVISKLDTFRSRWTMKLRWRYRNPRSTWSIIHFTCDSENGACILSRRLAKSCSQYSIAKKMMEHKINHTVLLFTSNSDNTPLLNSSYWIFTKQSIVIHAFTKFCEVTGHNREKCTDTSENTKKYVNTSFTLQWCHITEDSNLQEWIVHCTTSISTSYKCYNDQKHFFSLDSPERSLPHLNYLL